MEEGAWASLLHSVEQRGLFERFFHPGKPHDDVLELLGTPSTISTFDDQKWYYIGQKSIQFAYKRPRVLDRNVVVVSFDESGYVTETTFYSLEDAQEIKPVARVTPTEGRDFTVLQQLLGNFGRLPSGVQSSPDLPGP